MRVVIVGAGPVGMVCALGLNRAGIKVTVLEQAGIVHRMITREDFARYELAEEITEHHPTWCARLAAWFGTFPPTSPWSG